MSWFLELLCMILLVAALPLTALAATSALFRYLDRDRR